MKQTFSLRTILLTCGIISLAACSTTHKNDQTNVADANAAYQSDDQALASGTGDESSFGDQASTSQRAQLNKRTYYFDFDSNTVRTSDKNAVVANAAYLVAHPQTKIIVEGNTDPRGSREYNIGLGERRAKAIAEILTAQGVSPSQFKVVSYGAEKLAANGRSESDYQLDRRVVLVYTQG